MDSVMDIANDKIPVFSFYVDENGEAVVVCPACGREKVIDASRFKDFSTALRIRCTCGEIFKGMLEKRKTYRKRVELDGTCVAGSDRPEAAMTVVDLSLGGLAFKTAEPHGLQVGDTLSVRFALDTPNRTIINQDIEVRQVQGLVVNVRFLSPYERNPDLGLYLMPLAQATHDD